MMIMMVIKKKIRIMIMILSLQDEKVRNPDSAYSSSKRVM